MEFTKDIFAFCVKKKKKTEKFNNKYNTTSISINREKGFYSDSTWNGKSREINSWCLFRIEIFLNFIERLSGQFINI